MTINYSIIIPHKNIPNLLRRCLNSIPPRDDIQIIVVDDNSDPDIVDFNIFPGSDRPDVEIVFTKEDKGAGYARNIGLDHATGKWLLFLDSDDFFSQNVSKILDEAIESPYDLIFYDNRTVMSDDITLESFRDSVYHRYIMEYLSSNDEGKLRYCFHPLWGKIIRHSVVDNNNIRFHETKWSNDEFFSCQIGLFSKSIHVVNEVLYVVTQRAGSLTSNYCGTKEEFNIRLNEALISEAFLNGNNVYPDLLQSDIIVRKYYRTHGLKAFLQTLLEQRIASRNQAKMAAFLLNVIKEKALRTISPAKS